MFCHPTSLCCDDGWDVCAFCLSSLMNGFPVQLTSRIPWLRCWKAIILPWTGLSPLFTSLCNNIAKEPGKKNKKTSGFYFKWYWMMLVTSGVESRTFQVSRPSRRELDQNSTEWYCVMCSSLFRTVQQQGPQIDTPPSHAAGRVHGVFGLISSS